MAGGGGERIKKIVQGERTACAKAQRCERTWCVVGTEGNSLLLRAYSARKKVEEDDWKEVRLQVRRPVGRLLR